MILWKVKWLCVILALAQAYTVTAQQFAFQVTFTDKNNTPYSLSTPLTYLSPRAMARRAAQGIAIDSTDLPVNPAYVDSVLTLTGGVLHGTSRWLNMCMVLVHDSAQITSLTGKPYINNITLVGYYSTNLHGRHTQTASAQRTTAGDCSYYGNTCVQSLLVHGNYLHNSGFNGEGKLIAVFDAGFIDVKNNPGYDSMLLNHRLVDTMDFVWRSNNVFQQDNHGSMVLSTMAGNLPGVFVGAAPRAMYALYLTEYNASDQPLELDNLLCGAERADSIGADVITESLGYDIFTYPPGSGQVFSQLDGKTTIGARAANMATSKGMLFVATAGNDGSPAIPGWGTHIMTPGDADSALTIGSVDASGTPSAFSGYGPNAAGQVKPDVSALGSAAAVLIGSGFGSDNGTSFSTPQVAGWAACLWQENPTATTGQLRRAIIKCADHYSDPGEQLGYGIPNFQCTSQVLNVRDTPPPFTAEKWLFATPNPFTSQLILSASPNASSDVDFQLIDMSGRLVWSAQYFLYKGYNNTLTISLSDLPGGLYILKAISATQHQVLKLEKK